MADWDEKGMRRDKMPPDIVKAYEILNLLAGEKRSAALTILARCEGLVKYYTDASIEPPDTESDGWWYPFL